MKSKRLKKKRKIDEKTGKKRDRQMKEKKKQKDKVRYR